MDKKKYSNIRKIIRKYNLKPISQRELSLFTLSCVALGYTELLKKQLGFSYKAIAALGDKGGFHTMFNVDHISGATKEFIGKNFKKLNYLAFDPAKEIFNNTKKQVKQAERSLYNNHFDCLRIIIKIYPDYMLSVGIYNCFWRYIGDAKTKGKLSSQQVKKISRERVIITNFYPQIEKLLQSCVNLTGKKNHFDGDLLKYFTKSEMEDYLEKKKITKKNLKILKQRQKKYFYIFVEKENKENVIINKDILESVYNEFFKINDKTITSIRGYVAYKGLAKGIVYNLQSKKNKPRKNFVLVASMTHPKDLILIKQSRAIITDEGGILSHAAITSRELKIPCIISTKIATKVLKDGDLVEVDANKGIVKILKKRTTL